MEITKILDLENDGKINMAVGGQCLYIRGNLDMYKYNLSDMSLSAQNTIFKKSGRARMFAIFDEFVFLVDFLDLYILRKDDLQVLDVFRLGENASSDVGGVLWFDNQKAYVKIRNGWIYVLDIKTRDVEKIETAGSSFWAYCIEENSLFAGTVKGELLDIDRKKFTITKRTSIGRMNIYGVVHYNGMLYTLSQDKTIKEVDAMTFEITRVVRNAARGMSEIAGIYKDTLVIVDSGHVALWDIATLQQRDRFSFPVGDYNSGVIIAGNRLFSHDRHSVYSTLLE